MPILSFRHDGLERFFRTKSKAGIQPKHAQRLNLQLGRLDASVQPADMNLPGWHWHPLSGKDAGRWSVRVNGNWRVTFTFDGRDAAQVDYEDYH